jgi:S1-C subfamily serine protease
MKTFFSSLLSAILGALLVYGAFTIYPPAQQTSQPNKTVKTQTVQTVRVQEELEPGAMTAQEIYQKYGNAVVHIKATVTNTYHDFFGLPEPDNQVATGSGFIISKDGYIVTNAHVVSSADQITIQFSDQAEEKAQLVGVDQGTDLAVLKIDLKNHKYGVLELADSKTAKVGQTVYAIGNPLGYDRSMSRGIISALDRVINAPNGIEIRGVIQTDAAVNPGNSGGPLLSSTGKVIGVTSQIASTGGEGSIGIAFAIPSSIVKKVFEDIKKNGKTSHPWLGIQGTTLKPDVAKKLDLKVSSGALIVSIIDPGPARAAGLQECDGQVLVNNEYYPTGGDIITKIGKTKIESMEDLVNEVNQYSAGETTTLTYLRDGKLKQIDLKLDERPENFNEPQLQLPPVR